MEQSLEPNGQVRPEPSEPTELWDVLAKKPGDEAATEALVRHYMPMVQRELSKARARLPRHIDREELHAAAFEALFFAVRSFKSEMGVPFSAYAHKRVWGAIVDRLRGMDGTPRTARKASRTLSDATNKFIQRTGRTPDAEELAEELGVSDDNLARLERHGMLSKMLSIDAITGSNQGESEPQAAYSRGFCAAEDNPLKKLADDEMKDLLVQGLKDLPDRERSILVLYYHEGIRFNEIAAAMNVTESRVSQMHSRALERLKAFLKRAEIEGGREWTQSEA